MLRRTSALREELIAQAEALRLGLVGFQTGTGDIAGLTHLAEAVQTVATEADSVSAARAELDAALTESRQTPVSQKPMGQTPMGQTTEVVRSVASGRVAAFADTEESLRHGA